MRLPECSEGERYGKPLKVPAARQKLGVPRRQCRDTVAQFGAVQNREKQ
jgi:hypothetical protein